MNWYITKLVYQIICGRGAHTPQFDEQLRLISAGSEEEAFEKAVQIGHSEQETFCNAKTELVQWKFINVSELYQLSDLVDGAEIYSRISEVDDGQSYVHVVNRKAAAIREKSIHHHFQFS